MSRRTERVADQVKEIIAEILLREVKDPRIGLVSLTRVEITADLRRARVRFSVIGDTAQQDRSLRGLQSASGFIRREVGQRLRLRVVPELTFEYDPGIESAVRVGELLRESGDDEGSA